MKAHLHALPFFVMSAFCLVLIWIQISKTQPADVLERVDHLEKQVAEALTVTPKDVLREVIELRAEIRALESREKAD